MTGHMKSFSEKLLERRKLMHLTQQQLGDAVGVSLRSIWEYEKGNKTPRTKTMLRIAKALHVSVLYLTDDVCEDPSLDIEKDGYIEDARNRFGKTGEADIKKLLSDNTALLAGGELSQQQKDEFFEAVMKAYIVCKDAAKTKFSARAGG